MIHYRKASHLSQLISDLANQIANKHSTSDPFESDWIIVQNKETQDWIHSKISEENGISANVEFIYPSELIWKIYRLYKKEVPIELPTDRSALEVRILDELVSNQSELAPRGLQVPYDMLAKISLAESIADVFDLYLMYRPDLLTKWEKDVINKRDQEEWQAYLWRKVKSDISKLYPDLPDRVNLAKQVQKLVESGTVRLPNKITIFGLSHWSKPFNGFIEILSEIMEIYWFDQSIDENRLDDSRILQWAKPKFDVQQLLANESHHKSSVSVEVTDGNTLPSVSLHSCHNIEREIQVLRNELLNQFDNSVDLSADDVLIMVPDFETYAPVIEKEFTSNSDFPSIPVFIGTIQSDTTVQSIHSVFDFFLNGEKVNDFIELLSHQLLSNRFKFSEMDITSISELFAEMNIHQGLTKLDSSFSIEKGLDQLYLGFLMDKGQYETYQQLIPFDLRSTMDALELISKLSSVVEWLKQLKSLLSDQKTIIEWARFISEWIKEVTPDTDLVNTKIDRLIKQIEYSEGRALISFEVFSYWIRRHIDDQSASSTRKGTGITVSSYIPYRNIPFKSVFILGLNEGVFPRNPFRPDFDLINRYPEKGDRITKEDDKLLFIERFLSTKSHLHLSYIGEGEQAKLPSPLVLELCDAYPEIPRYHHKLHGFSTLENTELPIYRNSETELADLINRTNINPEKSFEGIIEHKQNSSIQLHEFIEFFVQPSKYLCTRIVGLKNVFEESQPVDRESFVLNGLQRHFLKEEILQYSLDAVNSENFQNYGSIKGIIPRGIAGFSQFSEVNADIQQIVDLVETLTNSEPEIIDIDYSTSNFNLNGIISNIYENDRVVWTISKVKPKDLLSLWIHHLIASNEFRAFNNSTLIGYNDKQDFCEYRFKQIQQPEIYLNQLIELFTKELTTRDHWSCIPSLSKAVAAFQNDTIKQQKEIEKAWLSTEYSRKENADFYNRLIWSDSVPWDNDYFSDASKLIWNPILDYLEETSL